MNGAEQVAVAIRLQQALDAAGIRVSFSRREAVTGRYTLVPVPAVTIVGALLHRGWTIDDAPRYMGGRVLQLDPGGES